MPLQTERAQVVVALGVIRLGGNDLLERSRCLIQIAVLEHRHAVGKVIALKCALIEGPRKGQRPSHTFGSRDRHRSRICEKAVNFDWALVHLHDHALPIYEEGGRNREVPATVKEISIDDVVDSRQFLRRKEHRKRESFAGRKRSRLTNIASIVDVDGDDLHLPRNKCRLASMENFQLLTRKRRRDGPEVEKHQPAAKLFEFSRGAREIRQ